MSSQAGEIAVQSVGLEWTVTRVVNPAETDDCRDGLDGLDDAGLMAACQAGRRAAFDVLVERHQRPVYQLCYRFAGNHEDASDLCQEVFLRAYRALQKFRGDAAVSTWLYRIGVNACLNRVAARTAPTVTLDDTAELPAPPSDPADGLIAGQRAAQVRAAIAALPERQRATLILRVYHDRSHREIAGILGTTEGAAKANLFHALGNLKKLLAVRTL
ncbi:MAG: sigma-70 family RNA polymerase sigma factor [Vicinamibacterales bacterium]|nr:sigma-70 family RNA polymerase sigma factor [Vicinamibacterales bacterium]